MLYPAAYTVGAVHHIIILRLYFVFVLPVFRNKANKIIRMNSSQWDVPFRLN